MAETIGQSIAKLRAEKGLSRARTAREAGISNAYLVQIEKGDRNPSESVVRKLASALDASSYKLMCLAGFANIELDESIQSQVGDKLHHALVEGEKLHLTTQEADYLMELVQQGKNLEAESRTVSPQSPPPEGWQEIGDNDRRIIQLLITRLRRAGTD